MSNEDIARDAVQIDAFRQWCANDKVGTVEIATGVGKTFVALRALHSMPTKQEDNKVHLFLSEVTERENDILKNITVYDKKYSTNTLRDYNLQFHCYQSVYKWSDKDFGLVIADEVHDSLTPAYSKFYSNNNYDAIIGLSAKVDIDTTYPVQDDIIQTFVTKEYYLNKYCPIIYKFTMAQARKHNLNRNIQIHVIRHDLDDTKKNIVAGSKNKSFVQSEKSNYEYWTKRFDDLEKETDWTKKNIFRKIIISKRARLLYNLPSKVEACKKLLRHINRTIVFGNSIDALLKVTPYVISSRNSNEHNNYFRKTFEEGRINNLASFKKLKQGANITDVQNMILMSYYSKEKDAIQRFGRLRKQKDNEGCVFVFMTKKTVEEQWYMEMLKNIKGNYTINYYEGIDDCIKNMDCK